MRRKATACAGYGVRRASTDEDFSDPPSTWWPGNGEGGKRPTVCGLIPRPLLPWPAPLQAAGAGRTIVRAYRRTTATPHRNPPRAAKGRGAYARGPGVDPFRIDSLRIEANSSWQRIAALNRI